MLSLTPVIAPDMEPVVSNTNTMSVGTTVSLLAAVLARPLSTPSSMTVKLASVRSLTGLPVLSTKPGMLRVSSPLLSRVGLSEAEMDTVFSAAVMGAGGVPGRSA